MADPVSALVTVGLMAGNMALQASQTIEGPRLNDLTVTLSEYGTPMLRLLGTRRSDSCPYIYAEPLLEVKRQQKTKGGKYNQYEYYATFRVLLAGLPDAQLVKLWLDRHLVYDATGAGPIISNLVQVQNSGGSKGKGNADALFGQKLGAPVRYYSGDEAQLPDPRELVKTEAEFGVGSTPAYRGVSSLFFENLPLAKLGNHQPQIGALLTRSPGDNYVYEAFDVFLNGHDLENAIISPDGTRLLWANGDAFVLFDLPSRTVINSGYLPYSLYANPLCGNIAFRSDGTIVGLAATNGHDLLTFSPDCSTYIRDDEYYATQQLDLFVLTDGDGVEHVITTPIPAGGGSFYVDGVAFNMSSLTGVSWYPVFWFVDGHGDIWACGSRPGTFGTFTDAFFYRMINASGISRASDFLTIGSLPAAGGYTDVYAVHYLDETHDHFVMFWQGNSSSPTYLIDIDDGSILASGTPFGWTSSLPRMFKNVRAGDSSIWTGGVLSGKETSLADLSTIRTLDLSDWVVSDVGGLIYSPLLNAVIGWTQFTNTMTIRYLDRIAPGETTLADIVEEIAGLCGIDPADYDASALTQPVKGFGYLQAAAKDNLAPMLELHDSFARPHGFVLEFLQRGASPSGTIDGDELAAPDEDAPPFAQSRGQGADMPRAIALSFADVDADEQRNLARVARPLDSVDSARELPLDMFTTSLDVDEARDLADRFMRRRWVGRLRHGLALSAQHIALEPGDVKTLLLEGTSHIAWAASLRIDADRRIAVDWERDDPSVHDLAGQQGGSADGHPEDEIPVPGPVKGVVLDIPLISDADETRVPFLYYGAGRYGGAFLGVDFWMSDTLQYEDFMAGWAAVAAQQEMTWGLATDVLPDAEPWLFDRGSSINVAFRHGTPTGATEDELLADATLNLIAVGRPDNGWELLQFGSATLEGDGSWTLSTFLRGVRGTEHLIDGHESGDVVILLSTAAAKRTMGAGEIGDADAYRPVAGGRTLLDAFEQTLTFTAAAQKPYAPVHGALTLDGGSGDWSIDAVRRTRIGGANVDGGDVPIGETSESWAADILDGADVVRTITGTSLPLTYSSADQTTDFGAPQASLDVNLYQIAPDLNLRGYPLALAA